MYCPQCDHQFEGTRYYCPQCGVVFDENNTPTAAPSGGADPATSAEQSTEGAVLTTIRSLASSNAFLVAIIACTLMMLISLISSGQTATDTVAQLREATGISLPGLDTGISIGLLVGYIPQILIVVGLWFTYITASERHTAGINTAGLSMIKGVLIFEVVLLCLFMVVMLGYMFSDSFDRTLGYMLSGEEGVMAVGIPFYLRLIPVLVVGGVMVWMIVYYVKVITTINGIRESIRRGEALIHEVSRFVVVMNVLIGILTALSGVISLISWVGTPGSALPLLAVLSSLCGTVTYLAFAHCLKQYQKQLKPHRTQFWSYT